LSPGPSMALQLPEQCACQSSGKLLSNGSSGEYRSIDPAEESVQGLLHPVILTAVNAFFRPAVRMLFPRVTILVSMKQALRWPWAASKTVKLQRPARATVCSHSLWDMATRCAFSRAAGLSWRRGTTKNSEARPPTRSGTYASRVAASALIQPQLLPNTHRANAVFSIGWAR
jgi:hypothetical protein